MEAAITIHPIFFLSKDFHRDSCSGEEWVSVIADSESFNSQGRRTRDAKSLRDRRKSLLASEETRFLHFLGWS